MATLRTDILQPSRGQRCLFKAIEIILIVVFILTLGLDSIVNAANIPHVGTILQPYTQNTQTDSVSRTRPEPAALQAGWWHYFEVEEKEEFKRRLQETKHNLKTLLGELPKETSKAARPLVERIETNLQALAEAKEQPTPSPPPPPAYRKSYTISELLDVIERTRRVQSDLQAERSEVRNAEKAIEIANEGVDTQMAAYLNLDLTDPERALRGLQIMADRSAVAVAEEQLRIRRAMLLAHEVLVTQLADKRAVAVDRLVAEQSALERLNTQIRQAEAILKQAQERVTQEQTTALSIAANKAKRTTLPYQQQRVVHTKVEEAIARVRLIRLQAQRRLTLLLLNIPANGAGDLHQYLRQWSAQLSDIRKDAAGWNDDSQQERDHAAQGMASGATLAGGAVPLFGVLYGDRLALAQQTLVALQRLEEAMTQVEALIRVVSEELVRREGGLRDWMVRSEFALQHFAARSIEWASQSLFKIGDTPVTTLGLMRIALILFITWLISYWFRKILMRLSEHQATVTRSALYTVGRLSHYGLIVVGFMIGLATIGIDFTNFALVVGALGIGIGFGLKSIVSNFLAGLILLFERTLKVGDFVELGSGAVGEVRSINVRSTVVTTNDNVDIVVPNSKFIDDDVTNWTLLEAYRRIHIRFKVPYGTDVDLVAKIGLEAANNVPYTLKERKNSVWLVDFGDSSFEFELVVWITSDAVKRPGAVSAAYKREIAVTLCKYGIEIPVPQSEMRLHADSQEPYKPMSIVP